MSVIQAGNTTNTSLIYMGDTTGNLVFTTGGANTVALTLSNTQAATFAGSVTVPAAGISFSDGSSIASHAAPNVTTYTSGSGTYTTPTGAKWLQVKMCAGGGGGGGGGTGAQGGGTAGANSTFGTSLLTCLGGSGGTNIGAGGGGATIGSGASGLALTGGRGQGSIYVGTAFGSVSGAAGGMNPFGGSGSSVYYNSAGDVGQANTGAGGAGGSIQQANGTYAGAGGGAGGYIEAIIPSPSATYSYAVGAGGTGGTGGTSGLAGGAGGSGVIFITAYF